jgi:hypothetical protein
VVVVVAGYEDGGLDEAGEGARSRRRASGRARGTLPCLLRERGRRDRLEYWSSKTVLRSGIWTARLLLAVGLELDDDEGAAVGAMAGTVVDRSAGQKTMLPEAGAMGSLESGEMAWRLKRAGR